jgi:hypothetical protein
MEKLENFTSLYEINCNEKTDRVLSAVVYDTDGKIVSSSFNETKWENIVPNSIGDSFLNKVCK